MSAVGGRADIIRRKADIASRRSASRQALRLFVHRQKPSHGRLHQIFKFWRDRQPSWGPMASRGERRILSEAQGERLAPGRDRFHLPVGQPLASECRSIVNWDPCFGLMRLGLTPPRYTHSDTSPPGRSVHHGYWTDEAWAGVRSAVPSRPGWNLPKGRAHGRKPDARTGPSKGARRNPACRFQNRYETTL